VPRCRGVAVTLCRGVALWKTPFNCDAEFMHTGAMGLLELLAPNLVDVVRRDIWWMGWNTFLAWVPVALACILFHRKTFREASGNTSGNGFRKRSPFWWAGFLLFVLFLPNAPYVVTDLVHLRRDLMLAEHDGAAVTAVLPVYAVFIGSGFLAYYLALSGLRRYLVRAGLGEWQGRVTVAAHAVCAVGVFLGRWARLNSWEPVIDPDGTLERIVLHLTWSWAPILILVTFLVTWVGHFVTKAIAEATRDSILRGVDRLQVALAARRSPESP
jgi:uncharacterized membrane protein